MDTINSSIDTTKTPPDRAPSGRFLKGHNRPGPGRPLGYRQRNKDLATSLVKPEHIRTAYKLLWKAIATGDLDALKFFYTYYIGPLEINKLEVSQAEAKNPEELRQEFLDLVNSSISQPN